METSRYRIGIKFSHLDREKVGRGSTHKMFLGLMMKHHRVQIAPVAVKARFCVRESFSAGRERSLIPAMTMAHYFPS